MQYNYRLKFETLTVAQFPLQSLLLPAACCLLPAAGAPVSDLWGMAVQCMVQLSLQQLFRCAVSGICRVSSLLDGNECARMLMDVNGERHAFAQVRRYAHPKVW